MARKDSQLYRSSHAWSTASDGGPWYGLVSDVWRNTLVSYSKISCTGPGFPVIQNSKIIHVPFHLLYSLWSEANRLPKYIGRTMSATFRSTESARSAIRGMRQHNPRHLGSTLEEYSFSRLPEVVDSGRSGYRSSSDCRDMVSELGMSTKMAWYLL